MALSGNSTTLQALQPWLRPYATWLVSQGPSVGVTSLRITSVKRSRAQQRQLYSKFMAGQSNYPALPPGHSKHELGLAFDLVTEPYSALWKLGALWKTVGGFWDASDAIHFEVR